MDRGTDRTFRLRWLSKGPFSLKITPEQHKGATVLVCPGLRGLLRHWTLSCWIWGSEGEAERLITPEEEQENLYVHWNQETAVTIVKQLYSNNDINKKREESNNRQPYFLCVTGERRGKGMDSEWGGRSDPGSCREVIGEAGFPAEPLKAPGERFYPLWTRLQGSPHEVVMCISQDRPASPSSHTKVCPDLRTRSRFWVASRPETPTRAWGRGGGVEHEKLVKNG